MLCCCVYISECGFYVLSCDLFGCLACWEEGHDGGLEEGKVAALVVVMWVEGCGDIGAV